MKKTEIKLKLIDGVEHEWVECPFTDSGEWFPLVQTDYSLAPKIKDIDLDDFDPWYVPPSKTKVVEVQQPYQIDHIVDGDQVHIMEISTGEVLASYSAHDAKPSPICEMTIRGCRNWDDAKALAKQSGTTQYKTYDWIEDYQKEFTWLAVKHGQKMALSKPVIKLLESLLPAVVTHNLILVDRKYLCQLLGCRNTKLTEKLKVLTDRGLATVTTEGLTKGFIKIELHPKLIFKGDFELKEFVYKQWIGERSTPVEHWKLETVRE